MKLLITARRIATTARDAVRSVVAPAALVVDQAQDVEPTTAPDPTDVFTADDMPAVETIEAAAAAFDEAAAQARTADRAKRKARKLIDRLPSGTYGQWDIFRVQSSRQTPDLVAIRATYERLGLGEVPMRDTAPSLKVERAVAVLTVVPQPETAELIAA